MAKLTQFPVFRAFTTTGTLAGLQGGKLYSYEAGTSTPKTTYTDSTGSVGNANPLTLDSTGTANVWLGSGGYKLKLTDSNFNEQWTIDNINNTESVEYLDTVDTDLRALAEGASDYVYATGHTTKGDGGGGWFYWDGSSSSTDDNGTVIIPDTTPATGRWLRVWNGVLNTAQFGLPTVAADDNTGFTAMDTALASLGGTLEVLPGAYTLTGNFNLSTNVLMKEHQGVTYAGGYSVNYFGGQIAPLAFALGSKITDGFVKYDTGTDTLALGAAGIDIASFTSSGLVLENTSTCSLTITSDATGSSIINFGDSDDVDIANINYNNSSNTMALTINTTNVLSITGSSFTYQVPIVAVASTTIAAGVRIPSGADPDVPASGELWFDGTNLKFYDGFSTRVITWS